MTKPVLVIGSRHDVKLPNLHFKNIYSANGAADLVKNYKKNFNDICHISTFGVQEFLKNISVRERIVKSKPDRLIIRNGNLNIKNYDFENLSEVTKISGFKDMSVQISKLDLSIFGFISSELKYTENKKINYFFRCLKNGFFQGFSSGLFAALIAATENPLSEIIISGIGLQDGGGHFYTNEDHKGFFSKNDKLNQSNQFRNTNRKRVEEWLFKNLKTDVKNRFSSPNIEFCKSANIKHLNCSIIDKFFI